MATAVNESFTDTADGDPYGFYDRVRFELRGTRIRRDQPLLMLDSSANRDPGRLACPDQVDLGRQSWRDHLAFSLGPRTCVGAALARAEIREAVAKMLERLPNLRLDPAAEQPRFDGFMLRSYRPLHALVEQGAGGASPREEVLPDVGSGRA